MDCVFDVCMYDLMLMLMLMVLLFSRTSQNKFQKTCVCVAFLCFVLVDSSPSKYGSSQQPLLRAVTAGL